MESHFHSSELILNTDGSVYHLHLLPEHLANTVITVGDPDRVEMVSKHFDRIEFKNHKREFITHTGYIGNKRISVISTGIGTDNIEIVFNELHLLKNFDFATQEFKPEPVSMNLIRIGTSGCVQPDIPVNTLLASEYGIGIDNVMHFYRFRNTEEEIQLLERFKMHCYFHHTIHPYLFKGDTALLSHFTTDHIQGITITAPGFYAPQGRKISLPVTQEQFFEDIVSFRYGDRRITNFEMETSAMYGFARMMGHRSLSLNVLLANRATGEFSKDPQAAVELLIQKSLPAIAELTN